jgi:hypothetical protein
MMQNKKLFIVLSIAVVLVSVATFIAVRYFVQPRATAVNGPGGNVISLRGPDGQTKTYNLNIKPAAELPATQPAVNGLFVERKDNSLFVGTGDINVIVEAAPGEEPQTDMNFSGPKVEVVISAETVVYKDTTQLNSENPGAEVQQTVETSTLDEIGKQSSITVWGRKSGDRIIAEVLVYSNPVMIRPPQS